MRPLLFFAGALRVFGGTVAIEGGGTFSANTASEEGGEGPEPPSARDRPLTKRRID